MTVLVLWENHAEGRARQFGPHSFLIACVAAELGRPPEARFALRDLIDFRTCNGNNKLIEQLANRRLWSGGRQVVAVLDRDKIRKALHPTPATDDAAVAAVVARAASAERDRLQVALLADNVETLLGCVHAAPHQLALAQAKTSRNQAKLARDQILERAAADPLTYPHARRQMPSFDALVTTVARCLRPA